MNNNMYNQPNGMNVAPQQMPQPTTPVQPMVTAPQQPISGKQKAGATIDNLKKSLSGIDKDSAKKYVGMGSGALLILAMFLPYISISVYGITQKASLWDSDNTVFKILFMVLALVPIATFFLQKMKNLSFLTAGYALSFIVSAFDTAEGVNLSFGFYFMLIATIALIVVCIMDNLAEIKDAFAKKHAMATSSSSPNVGMQVPPSAVPSAPVAPMQQQPVGGMPVQPMNTPVMPQPMPQPMATPSVVSGPVQPVVQAVEVCNFCGQPRRNPADVTCPSCGQRY